MNRRISFCLAALAVVALSASSCKKVKSLTPDYPDPEVYTGDVTAEGYADLGLSVKWAAVNLGANIPEAAGFYYQWGDVNPAHDSVTIASYKFYDVDVRAYTADYETAGCALASKDDASSVVYSSDKVRIPTAEEAQELLTKCVWKYVSYNGQTGYLVTGLNGKSIFLPAAGYMADDGIVRENVSGLFWTRNMASKSGSYSTNDMKAFAKSIVISPVRYECGDSHRYLGCTIRPVYAE